MNTATLIRLILRRDRVWQPLWILSVTLFVATTVATIRELLPAPEALRQYVDEIAANPAVMLLQGPAYGDSVGAAAVGRHAPLTAALIVVLGANLVPAATITAVGVSAGLPLAGSLAWGLMAASAGWPGAALAAVAVQLTQRARPAGFLAFTVFFAAYLIRGFSDLGGPGLEWLGWLVPNGWILRARAFGGEQWWVFPMVAIFVAGLLWAAYALSARRDVGAGLVPSRPGPAQAPPGLNGPLGLAWRTHRGMALAWVAGAAFIGVALGLAGKDALEQFSQSGGLSFWAERTGAADPVDIFFRLVVYELAVFSVSLYAIMTVLRLRGEEGTELFLSGPVSRTRWALSHLAFAVTVPVVVLVIALEISWEVGLVSDSVFMISPFAHVHYSTLADPGPGTLLGLTLVAAGFTAVGLYGLRRRDLAM